MPLTRDTIVGHDPERLAFRFTMLNEGKLVPCQISDAAMDELAGAIGTEDSARQAQFFALRDNIEEIASELFEQLPPVEGYVVRIFTKHIKQRRPTVATDSTQEASPSLPQQPAADQNRLHVSPALARLPQAGDAQPDVGQQLDECTPTHLDGLGGDCQPTNL